MSFVIFSDSGMHWNLQLRRQSRLLDELPYSNIAEHCSGREDVERALLEILIELMQDETNRSHFSHTSLFHRFTLTVERTTTPTQRSTRAGVTWLVTFKVKYSQHNMCETWCVRFKEHNASVHVKRC